MSLPPALTQRYEVLATLGQGGMGVVYRALDRQLGREVALKLVLGERNQQRLKRFEREAAITAGLNHPNIVKLHAMQLAGDVPYLTYELVPGARTLDEVLPELSLRRKVEMLRDAARGLGHAHAAGVVHRDVKPQNLLVDEAGELKVADFGLAIANDVERLTRTGAMIGSPCYMAPELTVTREGGAEGSTDVWSLGVILYEVLTGELPFMANTLMELAKRIASDEAKRPSQIDRAVDRNLEAICLQALKKDRRERYADGDAFADDLEAWMADRPVTASTASGINVFIRRHRRLAKLAVPLLVCAALIGAALSYDPTPSAKVSTETADASSTPTPKLTPSASPTPESGPLRLVKVLRHGKPGFGVQVRFRSATELLTAGQDGRVRRWALPDGKSLENWTVGTPLRSLCLIPNGGWAAAGLRMVVTGSPGRTELVRHTVRDHMFSVGASPDGRFIAAGGKSGRVLVFPVEKSPGRLSRVRSFMHKSPVHALAFPDGRELLTVAGSRIDTSPSLEGNTVTRWSLETGKLIRSVGTGYNPVAVDWRSGVIMAGSTWGQVILYGEDLQVVKSLVGDKAVRALGSFSSSPAAHRGAVYGLRLTADGKRLFSVSGPIDSQGANELRAWDVPKRAELFMRALEASPVSVDVTSDGRRLAVGFTNGTANVWTVAE